MELAMIRPEIVTNSLSFGGRSESPLSEVPDEPFESKPKKQSRKRKTAIKVDVAISEKKVDADEHGARPKRQRRKRKAVKELTVEEEDNEGIAFEEKPQEKRRRKSKAVTTGDLVIEGEEGEQKSKKKRRRKTPEEDKIYDIPPIENVLSTTFKGRLGYACLNTILRKYSTRVFCSRTCRLSTIAELGISHAHSLGMQNLRDLHIIVKWNAQHGIYFMRMSSEMFPFASHPEHGYHLDFADEELKAVGRTARELGVRLTSHPGQFTQLGSPREVVVRNAVRDLEYHCEMMDRMGLDQDSVMIIHMGGAFGDKAATLERFRQNYTDLLSDSIKRRLVLENDELCYNVDDLLPLCRSLRIPLVFDYHHDWINPSSHPPSQLIPEINQLWYDKGIKPKQHYSEPRPGAVSVMEKRAHSDRVKSLPEGLPDNMDLMLECKDKEQAVFHLYRLYNLHEVDPKVLRPPAEVESLHTNGRKSNKRAKAKAARAATTGSEEMEVETNTAAEAAEKGEVPNADNENEDERKEGELLVGAEAVLEHEAEEHGLPSARSALTDELAPAGGELDCGSGDEVPDVEVEDGAQALKGRKTRKRSGKGDAVDARLRRKARKGKGKAVAEHAGA